MKLKYVCLGKNLAKQENGFSDKGDWTLFKCFFDCPSGSTEFYFNFNERGDAEIVPKGGHSVEAFLQALEMTFKPEATEPKEELIDWKGFTDTLVKLSENDDKTISRHAKGLLKTLKL